MKWCVVVSTGYEVLYRIRTVEQSGRLQHGLQSYPFRSPCVMQRTRFRGVARGELQYALGCELLDSVDRFYDVPYTDRPGILSQSHSAVRTAHGSRYPFLCESLQYLLQEMKRYLKVRRDAVRRYEFTGGRLVCQVQTGLNAI